MDSTPELTIGCAADLEQAVVVRVARENARLALGNDLMRRIGDRRERVLATLTSGAPVYGVNTGMGAFSHRRLGEQAQRDHQEALLLARAVGGPPWLAPGEVRAALAVRLRTFLNNDSGASPGLCRHLVSLLDGGVCPAVPRTAMGAAGEIIALAHLAAPLTGGGQVLDAGGDAVAAGPVLRAAGIEPYRLGPKEGVALIEGVPVSTALAIMCAADADGVLRAATLTLAAQFALTGASRDSLRAELARGDDVLGEITGELRRLCGTVGEPRALQPPVSFRVSAGIMAHLRRASGQLRAAAGRALDGVTDSPAFLDNTAGVTDSPASPGGEGGRFVGTAGFSGYDLAAYLHLVTVALIGAAEAGAARLHRLMDPAISGLPAQLSPEPGRHTGISPVHKRAVGVVHAMRRLALPATVGTVETSAGQEDVQSFSLEAAQACRDALAGLTDVITCEQLAIHQMRLLGARLPTDAAPELAGLLDRLAGLLPGTTTDRPWGQDLTVLRAAFPGLATAGEMIPAEPTGADGRRSPRHVRIVHLPPPAFGPLADGELAAANAVSPVPLSEYFVSPEWKSTWRMRSEQVGQDPASAAWVTGVIWDEQQQVAVGRAGYHGPPDQSGMVEIGYAVDPAYRRRGYARAALEALLQRAAHEPRVKTVRVTISPGNTASYALASQYGFAEVGEQWDEEDGLEIIYEVPASVRHD